jgi:hypothetical protein
MKQDEVGHSLEKALSIVLSINSYDVIMDL